MDENIKPLYDNYLVAPLEEAKDLPGGLVLPDSSNKEQPMIGEVKAVPDGEWYEKGKQIVQPPIFTVGDKVIYRKWSVTEVEKDKLVIVNQKDIVGVYKK